MLCISFISYENKTLERNFLSDFGTLQPPRCKMLRYYRPVKLCRKDGTKFCERCLD